MPHTAGRMPALPTELPVVKVVGAAEGVEEGAGGIAGGWGRLAARPTEWQMEGACLE